jgi:hypothetical protein
MAGRGLTSATACSGGSCARPPTWAGDPQPRAGTRAGARAAAPTGRPRRRAVPGGWVRAPRRRPPARRPVRGDRGGPGRPRLTNESDAPGFDR